MMMQDSYIDVSKYVADKNGAKWSDVRKNIMSYHKVIKDIFLGKGNSENDFSNIKDTIENPLVTTGFVYKLLIITWSFVSFSKKKNGKDDNNNCDNDDVFHIVYFQI